MRFKKSYLLIVPVIAGIFFLGDSKFFFAKRSKENNLNVENPLSMTSKANVSFHLKKSVEVEEPRREFDGIKEDDRNFIGYLPPEKVKCIVDRVGDIPKGASKYFNQTQQMIHPDGRVEPTNFIFVGGKECPPFVYSKITVNQDNRVVDVKDCRDITIEQQLLESRTGFRKNMIGEIGSGEVKFGKPFNMHPQSRDYFAVRCIDGRLLLTRYGQARVNELGALIGNDDCFYMGRTETGYNLIELSEGETLNENGCFSGGTCLALVDPLKVDPKLIVVRDSPVVQAYMIPEDFERLPASEHPYVSAGGYEEQIPHEAREWNSGVPDEQTNMWTRMPSKSDCNF